MKKSSTNKVSNKGEDTKLKLVAKKLESTKNVITVRECTDAFVQNYTGNTSKYDKKKKRRRIIFLKF